jgi:hypothetical protein
VDKERKLQDHRERCAKNFGDSAEGMEPLGIRRIFRRSMEKFSLIYAKYLGDRKSKSMKPSQRPGYTLRSR